MNNTRVCRMAFAYVAKAEKKGRTACFAFVVLSLS